MNRAALSSQTGRNPFARVHADAASRIGTGLTLGSTLIILSILALILGNIAWNGLPGLSVRFLVSGAD